MTTTQTINTTPARTRPPRRRRILLGALAAVLALLAGYGVWTNVRPYSLQASVEIRATPEQVWAVLTDRAAYPRWNPFIVSSSGHLTVGATLTNRMHDATGDTTDTLPMFRAMDAALAHEVAGRG